MYFVFDLDDTLLTDEKKVSDYTKEVLKELQINGHKIVINTARTHMSLNTFIKDLDYDYAITDGGSCIYDSKDTLIFKATVDSDVALEIINDIKLTKRASRPSLQSLEWLYSEDFEYAKNNKWCEYIEDFSTLKLEATKLVIYSEDYEYMNSLAERYNLILTRYFSGNWYRISNSTKALGNDYLRKILGNDIYIVSFGDDSGDVEMLLNSDHGVCMKNSQESVLKVIKNVTEFDNNNDGCAKYILKFLKNIE